MAQALQPLFIAAFGVVIGTFLIILSATVVDNHNAWPLVSLVFYLISPVPFYFSRREEYSGGYYSDLSFLQVLARFLGGMLAASGTGLAVALYHVGIIGLPALILTLISGICFLSSARFVLLCLTGEDEDDMGEEDDIYG